MRIDRAALIRGLAGAAERERERRRAAAETRGREATERLLAELAEMGRRFVAVRAPGRDLQDDLELAGQLARAENWARVDELRKAPDLSAMEAVAVVMTVDFEAALRLLCELPRRTSSCGELGQEPRAG